ncbi:MAG: histidine phosphatase family protein [Acidobacteriota bacterium]|nr:histidine phosphatase family protein [Acidobacteriota bacterium]
MSLTLYFLRHGQTAASRDDVFCGSGLDPELTEDGERMARAFADAYRALPWRAIYTSPLRRTVATARPLCDACGVEMQLREGLREIGYGAWEGKTKTEVSRDYHDDFIKWEADPAWHAPTGGEPAVVIARRAQQTLEEIAAQFDDGNVLVVSHKATIRIMLCSLLGIDVGRFRYRLLCPTASVSVVEMTHNGPLLRTLADRSHLDERLRSLPGT